LGAPQHAETTGVTIDYIDEGIDAGEIVVQREFAIPPCETEAKLQYGSARVAAEMLKEPLPLLIAGSVAQTKQDWPTKGRSLL